MAPRPSEEFKRDAVRIALTSGLTRRQASSDLGVGMSTLGKWIRTYRDADVVSNEDQELAKENERLSARQVGAYLFIKKMQYDHRLIPVEGGTLSREKIEYSLSGGIFKPLLNTLIAARMLRGVNLAAHHELKKRVENK